jgi:hypothetical protein
MSFPPREKTLLALFFFEWAIQFKPNSQKKSSPTGLLVFKAQSGGLAGPLAQNL